MTRYFILDYLTGDEAVRRLAKLRDKWEMDDFFIKKRAREKEKMETAKKLLKRNMSVQDIIEITGLSEEEVKKIMES